MLIRVLILTLFLTVGFFAKAQQDEHFSQYRFNKVLFNPAFAGSKHFITSNIFYRYQWIDFEGPPVTQSMSIQGPMRNKKIGLGLHIINDQVGVLGKTSISSSYAYHIRTKVGSFGLGIQAGAIQARILGSKLRITDSNDPAIPLVNQTTWLPDAGVGFFYRIETFYIGASTLHLIEKDVNYTTAVQTSIGKLKKHFYLSSGYNVEFSPEVAMYISALAKYTEPAPIVFDINMSLLIHNTFWFGFAYRTKDAGVVNFGYHFNERFKFGYAFDFTISNLAAYNKGTHEVMLSYDLVKIKFPKLRKDKEED